MRMSNLLREKYENAEVDEIDLIHWEILEPNRYGFVYVKNPRYPIEDDDREYLIRKPTPEERREILINFVIQCNGRTFSIPALADKLGVTDRTIQRQLQKDGLIEITPRYRENGKQKGNAYKYIGPPCKKYGSGLTLKLLYSTDIDVGFRNWAWKEYEFAHNKIWHSIYPLCKEKFKCRIARTKYLQDNDYPLIVPEDIRYLVLRYCYWKGTYEMFREQSKCGWLHPKDGTIKIPIEPLNRTETVKFFDHTLAVEINGTKDNPQIKITDTADGEVLGTFTWFDENIIDGSYETDDGLLEQFFILGDFATK